MRAPANPAIPYRGHFYSLDVLRGFAALAVVVFHWQMLLVGVRPPAPDNPHPQPLYVLLQPFYDDGWRAVELFFCLSGFIFFWLYSERISENKVLLKEFVVLRFSRLYPLHFATLLFVAVAQWFVFRSFGYFFATGNNDLYHFILQIFFVSGWGFERGYSYNGPVWSVSIEVLLYALFFVLCRAKVQRWWFLVLLAGFGHLLLHWNLYNLSRGILSFFMGGLAYQLFVHLWRRRISRSLLIGLVAVTALMWIVIPVNSDDHSIYRSFGASSLSASLRIAHRDLVGELLLSLDSISFQAVLFPLSILTLALCEAFRGTLGKRLSFIGNISYSIYLLHFPLQLIFILTAFAFGWPRTIFYSPWTLLAFFALLIPLSLASYHFLERPTQNFLRALLLPSSPIEPRNEEGHTSDFNNTPSAAPR